MKLSLMGADAQSLELARWAVLHGGHELVAGYDLGSWAAEVAVIAPRAKLGGDWESLLLGTQADAVIFGGGRAGLASTSGIADDERRADQLRKLAQAAVPMLVICPACEAIVGFEIEMIRRESGGVIVPYVPGEQHPALGQWIAAIQQPQSSPVGRIEQVLLEREQANRSRAAVLVQLARDASLLRRLIGAIRSVTATGPAPKIGRDPMGPKSKELPALGNLSVSLSGDSDAAARWSVGPVVEREAGRLTVVGDRGRASLQLDSSGSDVAEAKAAFARLLDPADATGKSAWLNACRDQEVAEAIDRSLARGRTIELFNEQHTEEASFKGVMAMGGCLLLLAALAVVLLVSVVEGLRLPLRDWVVWRFWPVYLLVPIAVFLALQLLQTIVKKEPARQPAD